MVHFINYFGVLLKKRGRSRQKGPFPNPGRSLKKQKFSRRLFFLLPEPLERLHDDVRLFPAGPTGSAIQGIPDIGPQGVLPLEALAPLVKILVLARFGSFSGRSGSVQSHAESYLKSLRRVRNISGTGPICWY